MNLNTKVASQCINCGLSFNKQRCHIKPHQLNSGKFCSTSCYNEWRRLHNREIRLCRYCGVSFEVHKSKGQVFCSLKCRQRWMHENRRGKQHPSWRGGETEKNCIICGQAFFVKQGRDTSALYCSPKCHGKATRVRMSQNNPMLREDVREQVGKTLKHQWQNSEFRETHIGGSLKGITKRPTSLEKQLISIIEREGLPYKYTGDGSFLIGWKNPDFVNVNGAKVCIEVANHFHHPDPWAEKRKAHFAKYGWQCYIFFPKDRDALDEQEVLATLRR